MAFVVIEIEAPNQSIANLNQKAMRGSSNPQEGIIALQNLLAEIVSGSIPGSAQVTSRNVTASISTSGTGSTQQTYNLK